MANVEAVFYWDTPDTDDHIAPDAVIPAQPLPPAPLSLLSSVPILDSPGVANNLPPDDQAPPPADLFPEWQRWVAGFTFLPEEIGPAEGYGIGCPPPEFDTGNNCPGRGAWSTFVAVKRDQRSTAGWKGSDAQARVTRSLLAHEAWIVENEWWTGTLNPNNDHLNAADPFYPAGQQVGGSPSTAVGLQDGLGLLEQAIAAADAGVGVIHLTPFMFNALATRGGIPFRYDGGTNPRMSAHIYTPNGNLVVPGYGYDGSAPADQTPIDNPQWQTTQWAYVTDMLWLLRGVITPEPIKMQSQAPQIYQTNDITWFATRPWGIFTNSGLRAAVLIDSTMP